MFTRAVLAAVVLSTASVIAGCGTHTADNSECPLGAICSGSSADAGQDVEVDASDADGTDYECPEAHARARVFTSEQPEWHDSVIETGPLEEIRFDASQSTGDISSFEWSVIERPPGSTQVFHGTDDIEATRFFLDVVGTYRFKLQLLDPDGRSNCNDDPIIEVTAAPDDDLYIELVWDTLADDDQTDTFGTDLSLHYLHPDGRWNAPPWDIFWRNSVADWGPEGSTGDPSLDIDDTDGAGPEVIRHNGLEAVTYRVGVHYLADRELGPSDATVRIYSGESLVLESERRLESTGWFWEVAEIDGPEVGVTEIDELNWRFPEAD